MVEKIDRTHLPQKWVHSHEEDTADEMVFRPSSYAFPPSRGRKSFQLSAQGKLLSFGIGPDDRTVHGEGRWQLDDGDKLTFRTEGTQPPRSMRLLYVGPDKLVVKKQ